MDEKMKNLFDVANQITSASINRTTNQSGEAADSKHCFVLDKLVF
jgi:hypothetical protein